MFSEVGKPLKEESNEGGFVPLAIIPLKKL